ncbi:MAG: late competence development ComFB family protein [Candidatus Wallbacteria bacterium]|nr:late competence development ComFB family protein [Candidatus Wallbacteria bacterium]
MSLGNMENLQEERVVNLVREILQSEDYADVCRCSHCFVDITAIALNALPPEYVADKFYKFPESPDVVKAKREAADGAIRAAIQKVTQRPHHD